MPPLVSHLLAQLWNGLLDIIYPPFCVVCGKPDQDYLCKECCDQITLLRSQQCRRCGRPHSDFVKAHCECSNQEYYFDQARCVGIYDGVLREAIHALKYDSQIAVCEPLSRLMADEFSRVYPGLQLDLVVPVPIHKSRFLERGFNQATELGKRFAKSVGIPFSDTVLRKSRKTPDQVGLLEHERTTNVQGSFAVCQAAHLTGKKILLIDDVFTTGSTLSEAARILRQGGASSVHAYALARSV